MADFLKLMNKLPDGAYCIQDISQAMIGSKDKVRPHKHTEITFVTEEVNTNTVFNQTGKVGIVVWIDRESFNNAMKQAD